MKHFLYIFATMFLCTTILACAKGRDGKLTSFEYRHDNGMVYGAGKIFSARLSEDGTCVEIKIEKDLQVTTRTADLSFMDKLDAIISQYKMKKYKDYYKPVFEVLDGDTWGLSFGYSSGKRYESRGYVASPKNAREAIGAIENLFLEK